MEIQYSLEKQYHAEKKDLYKYVIFDYTVSWSNDLCVR